MAEEPLALELAPASPQVHAVANDLLFARAAWIVFPMHLMVDAIVRQRLHTDVVIADALMLGLSQVPGFARRFARLILPFWAAGMLYFWLPLVLHLRGPIHVADLYAAELRWFGIPGPQGAEMLPDFFARHHHALLDLLCGGAYLVYIVEIPIVVLLLTRRAPQQAAIISWSLLVVQVTGMLIYLLYPAAPPWYVQEVGLGPAQLATPSNPAGAARFDELLGVTYFASFYAKSSNVFGAMPSLHAALPTIVAVAFVGVRPRWAFWSATAFAALMYFSAVYLRHHYVWDVLIGAGIACAWTVALRYASVRASAS